MALGVVDLAGALPNPGDPGFPAIFATFVAFIGGAVAYLQRRPWAEIQMTVFQVGFFATGFAIVIYLIALVVEA